MIKKLLSTAIAIALSSSTIAIAKDSIDENSIDSEENQAHNIMTLEIKPTADKYEPEIKEVKEVKDESNDFEILDRLLSEYKAPELDEIQIKYQKESIEKINELYFDKENYNKEELNELFINFISMGLNEAADHILNNENTDIEINGFNKRGITPLIAASISTTAGGNTEYALKLIKLGADVNLGTLANKMSPTSFASITDNYQVLGLLIAAGSKFMKEDGLDYRPIDYAIANNSERSATILSEALSARIKEEMKKEPILNGQD